MLGIYTRRAGSKKVIETYNDAYALNDQAAFVWSRVGTGASIETLAKLVAARYEVELDRARDDVTQLLKRLVELGFVQPAPDDPAQGIADPFAGLPVSPAAAAKLAPDSVCVFICRVPPTHPDNGVLVVVGDPPHSEHDGGRTDASVTGSIRVQESVWSAGSAGEVHYWRPEQLQELLTRFASGIPSQEDRPPEPADQDVLRRLSSGIALTGSSELERYRRQLWSGGYALWYAENHKYIAENNLEDVAGMISVADFESAALSVYSAFELALNAALALEWDLSPVPLDLVERIARAGFPVDRREALLAVLLWRGYLNDPEGWVRAAARITEAILTEVEQRWFE